MLSKGAEKKRTIYSLLFNPLSNLNVLLEPVNYTGNWQAFQKNHRSRRVMQGEEVDRQSFLDLKFLRVLLFEKPIPEEKRRQS
jgi:hypothetical protein